MSLFKNRKQAGKLLAEKISKHPEIKDAQTDLVVLAVPRGGIIPAQEVAQKLSAPLDVVVVKKISAPGRPELAIGAIGETKGSKDVQQRIVEELDVDQQYLQKELQKKEREIERREKLFREGREPLDLQNKIVLIVDDGAATGETIIAAAREVWNNDPQKVVAALPVLPKDKLEKIEQEVDQLVYLQSPDLFFAVGQFYEQFSQVSDEQVLKILEDYSNAEK